MQIEALLKFKDYQFCPFFSDRQFTFYERDVLIASQIFNAVKPDCLMHDSFLLVLYLPLSRNSLEAELHKKIFNLVKTTQTLSAFL